MREFLQRASAPPAQNLRILQPTPYTITYTVSTRTLPRTVLGAFAHYANILLRVLVGLATALTLCTKWYLADRERLSPRFVQASSILQQWRILGLAEASPWKYLVPGALAISFLVFRRGYTEESLTVLRGLGIQIATSSSTYLQTPSIRFIPTTSVQDILIHEAFKGFEVRFYLAIVVKGEENIVVIFPQLLPKRAILEKVWRGSRKCLWESKDDTSAGHTGREGGKGKNVEQLK